MSVLTIHFPPRSQWPGWEYPKLALAAYDGALPHEARARPASARPHDKHAIPAELIVVSTLGGSDYASDSPIFLASAKDDPSREYVLTLKLVQAEYLPLPVMQSSATSDGTLELLNNILVSIIPNIPDAKTAAVTISDPMWEEVLWNKEQEEEDAESAPVDEEAVDGVFVCGNEGIVTQRRGDWIGVDRDRRSAFLIIGALKSEGLL